MKIAICIWGLCRSTEYTYDSFKKNILDIFEENNIEYSVFLHTWKITRKYTNTRADERNLFLKTTTWKYYNPILYQIDNQDEIDKELKLQSYRTHGDPWLTNSIFDYIPYSSLDNVIRSLYSLKKVTELWLNSGQTFDSIVYIRPDVRFTKQFDISWLDSLSDQTICLPDFHLIDGVNDRFAFGTPKIMKLYGMRYDLALQYSLRYPLHSEKFLAYILQKYGVTPQRIPFYFRRIRAGNIPYKGDLDLTN